MPVAGEGLKCSQQSWADSCFTHRCDLQMEMPEEALRFLVHLYLSASCSSCAPRGAKEHVGLWGHFTELQDG